MKKILAILLPFALLALILPYSAAADERVILTIGDINDRTGSRMEREQMEQENKIKEQERMVRALNTCADESPEAILKKVKKTVDAFVGDSEQFDDLTMMCLEYKGTNFRTA